MSRFTALFFASIISCQAFYNVGVLTYWLANRAYISSSLCENRAQPQLHCNGKCYLKKKLAEANNPAPASGSRLPGLKKGLELAECPSLATASVLIRPDFERLAGLPVGDVHYGSGFPHSVFHPPAQRA